MNLFNTKLIEITVGEYVVIYGGILMFMGFFFLGIQILLWRDKYK